MPANGRRDLIRRWKVNYEQLLLVELNLFLRTLRKVYWRVRCSSNHRQLWHWIENRGRIVASVALPPGRDFPALPEREAGWTPQSVWTIWRRHGPTHMLGIELKYFCCPVRSIITKPNALSRQLILAESRQLRCRCVQQEHGFELCLEIASLYEILPVLQTLL